MATEGERHRITLLSDGNIPRITLLVNEVPRCISTAMSKLRKIKLLRRET